MKYPRYLSDDMDNIGKMFKDDRSMYIYLPKMSLVDFKKAMRARYRNYDEQRVDDEYYRTFA